MISPSAILNLFRVLLASFLIVFGEGRIAAQEGDQREISKIPDRFFQVQDSQGFFWQAAGNGALTSGETQYLQSGLNLIVNDAAFSPEKGVEGAPGEGAENVELVLEEKREELGLVRSLWFDTERAAVRVHDSITNTTDETRVASVLLRTTYPFAWTSLHGETGEILSAAPQLTLAEAEGAIVVRFGPSDGRADTVILASDGQNGRQPELAASANRRELTLRYDLEIAPGKSSSLIHWIMLRALPDVTGVSDSLSEFWQRERLIRPGIESKLSDQFFNFGKEAFPDGEQSSSQLKSLLALNAVIDRVGIHRREEDLLWVNANSQVAGKVDSNTTVIIEAKHVGETAVPVSSIAAVAGGADGLSESRVFLRDGRVLVGRIQGEQLEFLIGDEEQSQSVLIEDLHLLLLSAEKDDGVAPRGTDLFVELNDGSVFAVTAENETAFQAAASWGVEMFPLAQLEEVGYVAAPSPHVVFKTIEGSRIASYLGSDPVSLELHNGSSVEVLSRSVRRIWRAGSSEIQITAAEFPWVRLAEMAGARPSSGFLVRGNNILSGNFSDPFLTFLVDGAEMKVATDQIKQMSRTAGDGGEQTNQFSVQLVSGDGLQGVPVEPFISIARAGGTTRIPLVDLLDFSREEES